MSMPAPLSTSMSKPIKLSPKDPYYVFNLLHNQVMSINNSKIFAGLMIIVLNIASRFVTIKLSKTMESYLKYTFSRDILVFAISWMGTRDIYIALAITITFMVLMDYMLNVMISYHHHYYYSYYYYYYHVSSSNENYYIFVDVIIFMY